jgi:hypothetical protein
MVERFNGRIEEVLQSHPSRSGDDPETTLHRHVRLYNQQLPQSALGSTSPLQAMKDWHEHKPQLFGKQTYHLPGCDIQRSLDECVFRRNRRRHTRSAFARLLGLGIGLGPATCRDFVRQRA